MAVSMIHPSKFYERHLKPILCPTVFQRCQQRLKYQPIREIEPGDTKDADPRIVAEICLDPQECPVEVGSRIYHDPAIEPILDDFHEIMDRKPSITLEADDHDWSKSGSDLQRVDGFDGFPDDCLVRPFKPDGDSPP